MLVNVQRLQECKDAVDFKFHFVVVEYFAIISGKLCAPQCVWLVQLFLIAINQNALLCDFEIL